MANAMRYLFLLCCLLGYHIASADLVYMPLSFELSTQTPVCEEGDIIKFTLRITNTDKDSTYPVMIPGSTNEGRKLLYMTAYTVDSNNFYTEVAREWGGDPGSTSLSGSTSGNVKVIQLKPGEHVDIKFNMHPRPHYEHNAADRHWFPRPLIAGEYQFLVWYQPFGIVPFDLYHYPDLFGSDASSTKLNFDKEGVPSKYCKVVIKPYDTSKKKYGVAERCDGDDCRFCQHIADGKWDKVSHAIDATVKTIAARPVLIDTMMTEDLSWLRKHKKVIYLSDPPQAMILPFPAYWTQTIGFRNDASLGGVKYFDMTFQLGKIYHHRSLMQSIFYLLGSNRQLFNTTDEDYVGLSEFKVNDMLHGW